MSQILSYDMQMLDILHLMMNVLDGLKLNLSPKNLIMHIICFGGDEPRPAKIYITHVYNLIMQKTKMKFEPKECVSLYIYN